jgi:hypothetical protein
MSRAKLFLPVVVLFLSFIFINKAFSQEPTITVQPFQILKCIGNSASTTVIAEGAATLQYQWYKDGNPIGTDSPILNFASLTLADEGIYFCNVSNGEGDIDTDPIEVSVVDGTPVINQVTTESELVCIGTNNLIEVDYTGENATITWYILSDIVGNTNQLQITNAQQANEGQYYCIVTNVCGQVTSETLDIDIVEHADISTQPTTQTICEGEDVTFTATTEGDFLNYLWLEDESLMIGETDPNLTIISPTYPHSIEYKLVAYNVCNNDTSNGVYVDINTFPLIDGQPIDLQECFGTDVALYAYATGTTETFYQWYNEDNNPLLGETNASLEIDMIANDTAHFYCSMTNICGTAYSDTVEVFTLMAPEITQQPVGGTICVGDNITLQAKANGSDPLYYQWLFNDSDVNGGNISGDESQNITITSITEGQAGTYTCNVSNMCGFIITDEAEVIVNTPPVTTEQPEDIVVCEAEELLININYSGTEPISFEWYLLESETLLGSDANYYTENADPANSGSYYCILENSCAEISTDTITVEILALPQITTHPEDESVCEGEYASMFVDASGAEPLDFLWYRNESSVSSQTNSILEYPSAQVNQTGIYFCRVSNICGYDDSGTAILTIGTEPAITWNPIDQNLCEHDTLNLIMDAQGDNYTLQWYFNDNPIPGEHDTVLNYTYIDASLAGSYYCSAYNSCAVVNTDTIEVIINPAPIMSLGDDIDLCDGEIITISPNDDFEHYNWNNGLSSQPSIEVQLSGTFILEVIGENSCKTLDTINVEFHPYHDILFGNDEIVACGPYTLNAGDGGYEYTWNTIPPQTTPSIYITESGDYSVTVIGDDFGCSTTESAYIDVREPINIELGTNQTAPLSSFVDIGVEAIYNSYIWSTGFDGPMLTVYGSTYGVGDHEFWLTAIATNGCTDTDTVTVSFWNDSRIEDDLRNAFIIYPNPSQGQILVSSEDQMIEQIEIISMTGQILKSIAIKSNEISLDLSNFAKGFYFIKISWKDKSITEKILIQ